MEYQKSSRHGLTQRPDIILHIPVDHSGAKITENNHAVWALKANGNSQDAIDDFAKLDQMFSALNYPLGFFININTDEHYLEIYKGEFKNRIIGFSVSLQNEVPQVKKAYFENNQLVTENV